jgi:NAD(P)-dependent dehydrogenase (short-subunit alcohol dehydrogenase family)
MRELEGRMVIVTGACGVLGSAVSELLAVRGARVVGFDRSENDRKCKVEFLGVDLADETACRRAVDGAVARSGPLHGLVNIAGGFEMGTLAQGGPGLWDRMYHMNLRTVLCASSAALPHFQERSAGRIVNVGAGAAAKGAAGMGAYAAAKSGVARLTESLAEEWRGAGFTVNAVAPHIIDTPANRAAMPDADFSKWTSPAAIARVIAFLLSDEASAVTGALIPVTGAR